MENRRVYLFEMMNDTNKEQFKKGKKLLTESQRQWKKENKSSGGMSSELIEQQVRDREYEYLKQKGLLK